MRSHKWCQCLPKFGGIVTCCRAEPSQTFGRILRGPSLADTRCKDCGRLLCGVAADPESQTVCVKTDSADTGCVTRPDQTRIWLRHIGRTSGQPTRQAAVGIECCGATHLWSTKIRPRDAAALWVAASAKTHYLRCQHNMASHYLAVQLNHTSSVVFRQWLHLVSTSELIFPRTVHSTIGDRAFCVTAARAWNTLTPSVQSSE